MDWSTISENPQTSTTRNRVVWTIEVFFLSAVVETVLLSPARTDDVFDIEWYLQMGLSCDS